MLKFSISLYRLVIAALILSMTANAQKHFNNVDANGVILDGYDAVAFFTDSGQPWSVRRSAQRRIDFSFILLSPTIRRVSR